MHADLDNGTLVMIGSGELTLTALLSLVLFTILEVTIASEVLP